MKKLTLVNFPYQFTDSGQFFPTIPIRLFSGKKFLATIALIDFGATVSIFRPDIAEHLGIVIDNGKEIFLGGVGGRIKGYLHKLEVVVASTKLFLPIVFSQEYLVSFNLLGRDSFFDKFKITFDEKNKVLRLD